LRIVKKKAITYPGLGKVRMVILSAEIRTYSMRTKKSPENKQPGVPQAHSAIALPLKTGLVRTDLAGIG
jgi:hypothetical protein